MAPPRPGRAARSGVSAAEKAKRAGRRKAAPPKAAKRVAAKRAAARPVDSVAELPRKASKAIKAAVDAIVKGKAKPRKAAGKRERELQLAVVGKRRKLCRKSRGPQKETVELLKSLLLTKGDYQRLVQRVPTIVRYSASDFVPAVLFLNSVLGLTWEEVAQAIRRRPFILTADMQAMGNAAGFLRDLGITSQQLAKMVAGWPQVILANVQVMIAKVEYFQSLGMSVQDMRCSILRYPMLLTLGIESNVRPKLKMLLSKYPEDEVLATLAQYPQMLGYSVNRIRLRMQTLLGLDYSGVTSLAYSLKLTNPVFAKRYCC